MPIGVRAGHCQGLGRDVDGDERGRGMLVGAGDGQAARSRADIDGPRLIDGPGQIEELDDHELRLGPGDEDGGRDLQGQRVELLAADQVGHGRPLGAAAHQVAKDGSGLLADLLLVVGVKLNPLPAEHMGQHDLGVEPGALRSSLRRKSVVQVRSRPIVQGSSGIFSSLGTISSKTCTGSGSRRRRFTCGVGPSAQIKSGPVKSDRRVVRGGPGRSGPGQGRRSPWITRSRL